MLCLTIAPVQFHTWLTTGIPDGQPKLLLSFLPYEDFPLLNFGMATASESLTLLTLRRSLESLKSVVMRTHHHATCGAWLIDLP